VPPSGGEVSVPVAVTAGGRAGGRTKASVSIHTDCQGQPSVAVGVEYNLAADEQGGRTPAKADGKKGEGHTEGGKGEKAGI
jgi:hypothetical protein